MNMQFADILAREAVGAWKIHGEPLVKGHGPVRFPQRDAGQAARTKLLAAQAVQRCLGGRTRNADDADGARWRAARRSNNRVSRQGCAVRG